MQVFAARDCAGCHEDVHVGQLGSNCRSCHLQDTWRPFGMREMHASTRFPLVGRHATASCRACHLGAEVGRFAQTDSACVSCHRRDLEATANPNHIGLGWVDNCDRCHVPTTWHQAQFVPN
ncbi:MAG: hypothetical protein R3F17_14665 [Planctomycetota bacterium]